MRSINWTRRDAGKEVEEGFRLALTGILPKHRASAIAAEFAAQAGFEFDQRLYAPHITLLRDAHAPAVLPPLGLNWPVGDFALVESARGAGGVEYQVLARWELGG